MKVFESDKFYTLLFKAPNSRYEILRYGRSIRVCFWRVRFKIVFTAPIKEKVNRKPIGETLRHWARLCNPMPVYCAMYSYDLVDHYRSNYPQEFKNYRALVNYFNDDSLDGEVYRAVESYLTKQEFEEYEAYHRDYAAESMNY